MMRFSIYFLVIPSAAAVRTSDISVNFPRVAHSGSRSTRQRPNRIVTGVTISARMPDLMEFDAAVAELDRALNESVVPTPSR